MLTLPGLIDPHVHLRDPGQTYKEDFLSGTQAALAGGFTMVMDMPNNSTPVTTEEILLNKEKIARGKIVCDLGFYFGSLGDNLQEFDKVKPHVLGLKLYLNPTTGNYLIDEKVFRNICLAWNQTPILVHAEENILEKIIKIGHEVGQKIHVCHISSKKELQIVLKAKEKGWNVTCGVTPHHLFLNGDRRLLEGVRRTPSRWRPLPYNVKPSLKPQSDVDFLWQNLKYIDVIESDHAPHTLEDKKQSVFGFPGLETTLPLLLTAAHKKKITIKDIIRLCHTNPAKIFNICHSENPTHIEIDENEEWIISNENLFTKCAWSPFHGWKVKGKIKKVVLRGIKIFENDKILVKPGFGNIIYNTKK